MGRCCNETCRGLEQGSLGTRRRAVMGDLEGRQEGVWQGVFSEPQLSRHLQARRVFPEATGCFTRELINDLTFARLNVNAALKLGWGSSTQL